MTCTTAVFQQCERFHSYEMRVLFHFEKKKKNHKSNHVHIKQLSTALTSAQFIISEFQMCQFIKTTILWGSALINNYFCIQPFWRAGEMPWWSISANVGLNLLWASTELWLIGSFLFFFNCHENKICPFCFIYHWQNEWELFVGSSCEQIVLLNVMLFICEFFSL